MNDIKVSVIVPVCNVGKYLRDCLDSVVNQTLHEIEIICVDDFSSDDSAEILKEYARADSRIVTIFHSTNLGTSQARKDGVAASRGKYVMFLDGDDFLAQNACEVALGAIVKNSVDMVQFGTNLIDLGASEKRAEIARRLLKPHPGVLKNSDLLRACFKEKKFRFHLWNKIYDGDLCRKAFSCVADGYFKTAEDMYAFFVIAHFAKSYAGIEDVLYNYNFGLGVTGGDALTLGQFKALCAEHDVYNAVGRFSATHLETRTYNDIMKRKDRTLFDECMNMCLSDLKKEDLSDGFQKLADTWGATDVICALAEKGWYDTTDLAEELRGVSFFDHVKRLKGKKLTIAAYYSRIRNGGAERVVAQSCNLWSNMKDAAGEPLYRVILITDGAPEKDEYPLDKKVERAFLPPFRRSQKKNYRARAEAWERILSKYSIDAVVYSMWVSRISFWDMLCVKGHKNKPAFLFHSHGFCGTPFSYTDYTALDHAAQYRLSDGVVVLSECDERYVSAFCPNTKYIPDMQTFSVADTPLSSREKNTILWCSRISREQKRPFDVVRMMEIVTREIPDAKLSIVGDGSKKLTAELKNLVAKLHLEKNVIFEGFKIDVAPYYRSTSVFVGTSSFESFWLTLGESLAHGVPIVAYELPWLTFMRDGRGIITVPQRRYDLMAREVISLLRDPERAKKIGLQGRAHAEDFEATDIGAKWKDMFDHIGEVTTPRLDPNEKILYESLCRFQHEGRKELFRGIRDAFAFTLRKNMDEIQRRMDHGPISAVKKFSPAEMLSIFERYRRERRERRRARRHERQYLYYKELPPEQFPDALKKWYRKYAGKKLNLEHPATFNEKIQWMKIHDLSPRKTLLSDKYLVREWIANKIGEKYLIPLLGVYDRFDDIDFDALPDKFVIKTNHDSVTRSIVTDKSKFDIAEAADFFNRRMRINYAFSAWLEPYYRDIVPKIIIEQYLENSEDELHDYKFWCFGGKVKFILVQTEWQKGLKSTVFDTEWNRLPFKVSRHQNAEDVAKPDNLDEMIALAEELARGFLHVRVDFFRLNDGSIKFGEMLFSPESGMCEWDPPEYDKIIGDLLELPIDKK